MCHPFPWMLSWALSPSESREAQLPKDLLVLGFSRAFPPVTFGSARAPGDGLKDLLQLHFLGRSCSCELSPLLPTPPPPTGGRSPRAPQHRCRERVCGSVGTCLCLSVGERRQKCLLGSLSLSQEESSPRELLAAQSWLQQSCASCYWAPQSQNDGVCFLQALRRSWLLVAHPHVCSPRKRPDTVMANGQRQVRTFSGRKPRWSLWAGHGSPRGGLGASLHSRMLKTAGCAASPGGSPAPSSWKAWDRGGGARRGRVRADGCCTSAHRLLRLQSRRGGGECQPVPKKLGSHFLPH